MKLTEVEILTDVLNSKVMFDKYPQIEYFKVVNGRKSHLIFTKYKSDKYEVTEYESNELKNSILDMFLVCSMDFNPYNLFFRRIFDRRR
jgi:hypothetical protein